MAKDNAQEVLREAACGYCRVDEHMLVKAMAAD